MKAVIKSCSKSIESLSYLYRGFIVGISGKWLFKSYFNSLSRFRLSFATLLVFLTIGASNVWGDQTNLVADVTLPDIPTTALNMSDPPENPDANGWIVMQPNTDIRNKEYTWFTALAWNTTEVTISNVSTYTAPFVQLNKEAVTTVRKNARTKAIRFTSATSISFLVSSGGDRTVYVSLYSYSNGEQKLIETKSAGNVATELLFTNLETSAEYIAYMYGSADSNSWIAEIAIKKASSSSGGDDPGTGDEVCYETIYDLTNEIGSAAKTADNATVTAGISLVLSDSKGRIKLTPESGYKFKNGDKITFSGTVGNTDKNFGLKIYASDGSTNAGELYVSGSNAGTGVSGTLTLSSDQAYIYIARYDGTTTTLTSCVINQTIECPPTCENQYTFAYGATANGDGKNIDDAAKVCFEQVESTSEFQATGFTIPNTAQYYWVGYNGYFYDDNLGEGSTKSKSSRNQFKYLPIAYLQSSSCSASGDAYYHAMEGAYGTLRIYNNSSDPNLFVGFIPAGYQMRYGTEGQADWANIQLTGDGSVWTSAVMDMTADLIAKKYYINIYSGASYSASDQGVAINTWTNGSTAISSMKRKTNSGENWTNGVTAGMRGFFRTWVDNCAINGYCHFVPTHRVVCDANWPAGASGTEPANTYSDDVSVEESKSVTLPSAPTAPAGYTFAGWNTAANGSGTNYTVGSTYTISAGVTANTTLYAKWTVNSYTVSFDLQGHGETITAQTINYGAKATQPTTPTATGYTFGGWYKETGCTNTYDFNTEVTSDITLYAKWTANKYDITYKDQGNANFSGTHADGYPTQHTYGTATTLRSPTKNGYTFGGWFTTSDCSGSAVTSLGATAYTADITLYAKWTIATYNIKYYEAIGDDATAQDLRGLTIGGAPTSYTIADAITLPALPAKTGYTATGWYTKWCVFEEEGGKGWEECATIMSQAAGYYGHINFIVKYTAEKYTVTLNTNGGTINAGNVTNYTYGEGATLPANVTKDGFTFGGWYDNDGCTGDAITTISNTATGNKTYWAKWNAATTDPTVTWTVAENAYAGQLVSVSVITTSDATLDANNLTTNTGTLVNATVNDKNITATLQVPGDASGTITLTLETEATENYNASTSTKTITLSECPTNGGGGEEVTTTLIKINLSITNENTNNTSGVEAIGTPGGTAYWANMGTSSPYKLNTNGAYVALELSSGYFQNGDVLKLDGSKAMLVYTGAHGSGTALGTTGEPSNDVITYTLDELPNNTNEIYIYRSSSTYNGTLTYMQVDRTTTSSGSGESTLETNLAWTTDPSAGVEKQVGDASFTYTASSNNSAGKITYSSSDESVATVDQTTGEVTTKAAGTTTITATIAAIGCYPTKSINYTLNVTSTDEPEPDNCGISECGNATLTYTINASTSTTNTADNLLSSATASNTTALEVNNKAVFSTITADEKGKAAAATNECFNPAPVMSSKITMHKGSSYNANTYLQFTFTVKSGYTFTPCDVQFIVQPVMSDANFRWVITDGTTEYGSGTANDVPVGAGNGATALLGLSSTSAMPAGTYYIRLYPYDNDGDNNSFRISNDVILKGTIEEVVCTEPDAPTAFTVGSITSNGATFTITDEANTNNYEIYYSTSNTAPTAETEATITTTEKTKAVTGLTATTTYYAWARAICNEEKKSSWVALTNNSFTTSADPEPSGCITITDFDTDLKTSANGKPDANNRYLYGYTSSEHEQPKYAITTTSTNNDGREGKGAYIRLDHNSTICIYSNNASTTTAAEGFADITSISLKIKLKKSAPTITIKVGETIIANAVSLNGANADDFVTFTYSGLSRLDGAVSIKNNDASSSDYNIYVDDIEICTSVISYTVTYDAGEGSVTPECVVTASSVNLPTPTRDGYTCTGWYTAASDGALIGLPGASYTPTEDITLHAQWKERTEYNITYVLNGASWVKEGASTYSVSTGYTLPISADMSNKGYTFNGWYSNAEFTGDVQTTIAANSTGDKTFYAKWTLDNYTITYNLNDGTNPDDAKSSYTMFDDDYDLPTPTRDGYTFIGWFSDEACTQGPITILPSGSTGDKTFYAKWGNTLTATWTITKIDGKLQRGGGNYTVTVYLNNADWDESGNKDDLELTATEGVILRNIEKTINTDGKAQVTAIFDITTNLAVDAETITFKLSVPTAGNYAAAEFTHSENLDECAAGSPTEISIFKGTTDGDKTNTSDAEKYKQDKTWTHTETGLKNTSNGVKDALFEITEWDNNAVNDVTYVRGIQQGGSNAEDNHFKLEIPETYTASIYIVYAVQGQSGYFSLGTTQDKPGDAKQADELWHGVVSSSNKVYAATINNIQPGTYYLLGNSDKCIFAEIKVTMIPTTGGADVDLKWDTTDDLTKTIEKGVGEPDFVYTATTTSNTLGTITYSSSDESVATVNQTTGLVDIHAAGTTTITATLAQSGCYAGKSISYEVEVLSNCTDVAGDIVYADGTSIENNTITKACNDEVVLKLVGHTQKDGTTYQWYKNGEVINGATDVTYTIPSADEGSYYVVSTNSGEMGNCSMASNNTIEVKNQGELTVTKLIDYWYVKNNRRTPDIALVQTKNATNFEIKSGENTIEEIGGCTFYLGEDGIIYLKGKQDDGSAPSGMTAGDINLSIAVSDACENSKSIEITIHIQAETARPSIAFVVDGTEKGEFSAANENHSTNSNLYKYLHYDAETNTTGKFDLTACNIYSTTDEKLIREHYSQFDAILVTDDPSTKIPKANYETKGYVNAFGTMIDVRPILTMEAFVSALKNWSCVKGEPSSPNPRQYTIKLECKDHEIYGNGLPDPEEGTNVWDEVDAETGEVYRYVTIVDKTKSPYTNLADDADTHNTPALQGFKSEDVGDLLGLGRISNNTLHAAVERQEEPAARLLLFGVQSKALPNALTDEGKQVIANILTYLLKTNMEEVDDCSNFFVGGDAADGTAWTNENNWAKSTLPTSETKVRILAPCVITNTIAKVAQIDIATSGNSVQKKNKVGNGECNGSLTISANAALVVTGKVRAAVAPKFGALSSTEVKDLSIGSAATGNGTLIFNNDAGDTKAGVAMYSIAKAGAGTTWQYIGIPHSDVHNAMPNYYDSWIYRWDPATGWVVVPTGGGVEPWVGYCITHPTEGHTYWMEGTLVETTSQEIEVPANSYQIIGNSWTAPIQIANFEEADFDGIATKSIYLFNTDSDPDGNNSVVENATDAARYAGGTYIVVPINSAEYTGNVTHIPSMQGFYVANNSTTDAGTLHLDYSKLVRPKSGQSVVGTPMHAPKRIAAKEDEPLVAKLVVRGSRYDDNLVVLEREDFTRGYDSGWDGEKWGGSAVSPLIWAVMESGLEAVTATPDMEGTIIGFRAGEDSEYTIYFDYDGMEEALYLLDTDTQIYTRILNGNSYTFTCADKGEHNRFILTRRAPEISTGVDSVNGKKTTAKKFIKDDKMFIFVNGTLYDATGKMVVR